MRRFFLPSYFIDSSSRVDREGLRNFVLQEMKKYRVLSESICTGRLDFWERLAMVANRSLSSDDRKPALNAIDQLIHLPEFIDSWMATALDSPERFEFFVLAKAHELKSGNPDKDYFWAMQIRHDQLVALVTVVEMLLDKMKLWTSLRPEAILEDPIFSGLTQYNVEQQIFLEAERIYKSRESDSK